MMKKNIGLTLLVMAGLACQTAEVMQEIAFPTSTATRAATSTNSSTATITPTASDTSTPTVTPTPTELTYVSGGTPIPAVESVISADNLDNLQELARWGQEGPFGRKLSANDRILFGQTNFDLTAFDALTKAVIWRFDVPTGIDDFAISDAAQTVAVADDAGIILLLDMATGELVRQWVSENDSIIALEFSENGNWLASSSFDVLDVWMVPGGDLVFNTRYDFATSEMWFLGDRLVVGRNSVYDVETGELISKQYILDVSDENRLFLDQRAVVRSLETGEAIREIPKVEGASLEAGTISPDGTQVALLYDGYPRALLKVFEITSGKEVQSVEIDLSELDLTYSGRCYGDGPGPLHFSILEFSADSTTVSIHTSYVETIAVDLKNGFVTAVFSPRPLDPLLEFPETGTNGNYLGFSRDGNWLVSGENLWELTTGASSGIPNVEFLGFSSDDRSIYAYQDKAILRYGLADMKLKNQISLGEESRDECSQVKSIAPNGSIFFEGGYSGGDSYISIIWELTDRVATLAEPPLYDHRLNVVFTADSKNMIVSAHAWSEDTSPEIVGYELSPRREIFSFDIEGRVRVEDLAVSQDLTRLAAITFDGGFVWDLTQLDKPAVELATDLDWRYNTLAISPDGALVALQTDPYSTVTTVSIFEAESGALLTKIGVEGDPLIYDIAFSSDGRYLAAVGSDGTIRIWGVPTE